MSDKANDTGDYEAELRDAIREAHNKILQLEKDRDSINADIEGVVSGLEARGISRRALKNGRAWALLNPDEQIAQDKAFDIVRDALRPPVDLLGNPEKSE